MSGIEATGYFLEAAGEPLVKRDFIIEPPGPSEAIVEVSACGLCHTDLGFQNGSVRPTAGLPLVLGHEVVGKVIAAGDQFTHLEGKPVVVPAVLPCGDCAFCRGGRGNACLNQKMPGNDIHGGFATHLRLPAAPLVATTQAPDSVDQRLLSVVADAVSTAYQAVLRSGLQRGDAAIVIGSGGVGGFTVQIARALGARVIACDVAPDRLTQIADFGAEVTLNIAGQSPRDVRKQVHGQCREWGIPSLNYRIFECSGTPDGQLTAFTLLQRGATLLQVGFTPAKVEVRLSNLMAFDATVHGSWGCAPERYPAVLELIYSGDVVLEPFVAHAPMSSVNAQLEAMAAHTLDRRMILDPTQ